MKKCIQFVYEVVAQILGDVLMPTLPHARAGSWSGHRHGAHISHTTAVIHQTTRSGWTGMNKTYINLLPVMTQLSRNSKNPISQVCKYTTAGKIYCLRLRIHVEMQHSILKKVRLLILRLGSHSSIHTHWVPT